MNRLFNELVCEHGSRLRRFVTRRIGNEADAADIAQQAFIEASNAYGDFAATQAFDLAVRHRIEPGAQLPVARARAAPTSSVRPRSRITPACNRIRNRSPRSEIMMVLSSALESLPENMRQILNLAGMENLSYEQIADILDVPLGTVRSRLSRARAALRQRMEAQGAVLPF